MHVCTYVSMYVCVYVRMYVSTHVCICMYVLGLEQISDYPDNYPRTKHPDLFLCILVLV